MQQTRFVPLVSLICIATVMFIFWTSRVLSKCSQRSTLVMVREPGKVREQRIAAGETVSDSLEESQCFSVWELLNSEYELMHIPSFSYDESIYIFSTAMSVREQSVYIMLPNPATEEWPMKHNFKSQFSCSFGPVSQAGNYTPAQIVDEVDGHYYVLICRIPQPLLECVIQRSGVQQASETYMAMCLIVNLHIQSSNILHIQSNVSRKEQRVPPLLARFKVCQPKQHRRDYLALCAQPITSRIWPIIPQWLEYNLMVGVEHFYLYSATGTREGLQHAVRPNFDSSQVTFKSWMAQHWPGRRTIFRQIVAQCDCLYSLKDHATWILFVDVDEYVLPAPQFRDVKSFLRNFTTFAAISMKSFNYQYPPQHDALLISSTRTAVNPDPIRFKYFCQTAKTKAVTVHRISLPRERSATMIAPEDKLRVNHYRHLPANIFTANDATMPDRSLKELTQRIHTRRSGVG